MITPSSQAPGTLGEGIDARNSGTATLSKGGTYTGTIDRDYRVIITDPTPGAEKFIYSDDGGANFSGDIAATSLTWITLSHNVQIMFTPGAEGPQVGIADEWRFKAFRPHGVANLIDLNRDNECRTGAIAAGAGFSWTFDLLSARQPLALILFDHNIPAGSGIFLNASTTSNFAVLNVNQAIPWAASKILYVISGVHTYRYWRLVVNNLPSAVSYIRASELYLGGMYTMAKEFEIQPVYSDAVVGQSPEAVLMRGPGSLPFRPKRYQLEFPALRTSIAGDLLILRNVQALIYDASRLSQLPFWIYFNSVGGLEIFELVNWLGDYDEQHVFLDRVDVPVELLSVVRTAA